MTVVYVKIVATVTYTTINYSLKAYIIIILVLAITNILAEILIRVVYVLLPNGLLSNFLLAFYIS